MTSPDQIYTTYIKTTPEKLWAAITTPEFARQYWGGNANISDWKKGATWQHKSADGKTYVTGEVIESTPPSRSAGPGRRILPMSRPFVLTSRK